MKIVACCKIVPNEEMIKVLPDRDIDLADAQAKISEYDLNALECGKRLAAETGGTMTALTLGKGAVLEPTKIQKDILSRGAADLALLIDDREFAGSLETAKALAEAVKSMNDVDLVLCGTGSADLYAQEVGIQLGELLGWATLNNVTNVKVTDDGLETERTLENSAEIFAVPLPAVLSLSSEINTPAIPSMRDIMGAGKKPVNRLEADLSGIDTSVSTVSQLAPEQQTRRLEIIEGDDEKAVEALAAFIKKEIL